MQFNVLIPYLQGSLFRRSINICGCCTRSLNPLSTGKSVQTISFCVYGRHISVLIPYLQGSLFRLRVVEGEVVSANILIPYLQGSLFRQNP